jgi:DNA invertase Pin-like site-specific DNA recombinase
MPKHSGKWISYLRVSTDRQGKTGWGIAAQRKAVADFLNGGRWALAHEFVEVESGRRGDRPQLAAALALCRKLKAALVIAKLDRLTRNTKFLLTLSTQVSTLSSVICHRSHPGLWVGSS